MGSLVAAKLREPRILLYDIEATNLNANFGFTLCIGYMWYGEIKPKVISVLDFPNHFRRDSTDDKLVLKEFIKVVAEADMVVYHYGQRYDEPFINTRLLIHNLPPMPPVAFLDTWKVARDKLKLHTNRLATLIETFNIEEKKTPLNGPIWISAGAGSRQAIKYVIKHCYQDVLTLGLVYEKIRVLAGKWHPYMPLFTGAVYGCQVCGSKRLRRDGLCFSKQQARQRHQCKDCGGVTLGGVVQKYRLPVLGKQTPTEAKIIPKSC